MSEIKFLDLSYHNSFLKTEMLEFMSELLERGDFVKGKAVSDFNNQFLEFIKADFGVPCANGTDALEIIIHSLELNKGSSIVVPNNTFFATAEAVVNLGHKVILCDFDTMTQNLCSKKLRKLCENQKVDAVIFVHLYGNTDGIIEVKSVCEQYNIPLIEDCAQAHGAKYGDISAGNFGIASAFSFYPGKTLGAMGDAGMVITNDPELYEKCCRVSDHGRLNKFDHNLFGRNSRMDTIQAKYLSLRLLNLKQDLKSREFCRAYYFENIDASLYTMYKKSDNVEHGNHLFPIRSKNGVRNALETKLKEFGIPIGCHYPLLLSENNLFSGKKTLSEKQSTQRNLLSLPIGPHLKEFELNYIVERLNSL